MKASLTDRAIEAYEVAKPYLIYGAIPFGLLYCIDFIKMLLTLASMAVLGFITFWAACFFVGMYIGVVEKFVNVETKLGKLTNLRIFKVIVTFDWGYRCAEWLFEDLEKKK